MTRPAAAVIVLMLLLLPMSDGPDPALGRADTPPALQVGTTHTRFSADVWNDTASVAFARMALRRSTTYQNQHIMGWGALNPQPAPNHYDWGTLDQRVALMRATGATMVVTLAGAPDWMKGGQPHTTDWDALEEAPLPEHYDDFAALAAAVAARYPDVGYFQVWNEMKGFYDADENHWDYRAYTDLYNRVYDAIKEVRPDAAVGGPYVVMDSWGDPGVMSHPSELSGPWGMVDQRALDVIDHWLRHKHGADFITVDGPSTVRSGIQRTDPFTATDKFAAVTRWIRSRTELPVWWGEWYTGSLMAPSGDQQHAALKSTALIRMAESGVAVALGWEPQAELDGTCVGSCLWTDTRSPGGGRTTAIADAFTAWTRLTRANEPLTPITTPPGTAVIATPTNAFMVNQGREPAAVRLDDVTHRLGPYEVRLVPRVDANTRGRTSRSLPQHGIMQPVSQDLR